MRSSTTAIRRAIPEMPSSVFVRLVERLSSEQLRRFPPQRIPTGLPDDFTERLPTGKRSIVTDLMLEAEADRLRSRFDLADRYGEPLVEALQGLEHACEPRGLRRCARALGELEEAAADGDRRSEAVQALAVALAGIYPDYSGLHAAIERIRDAHPDPADRSRFGRAVEHARAVLAPMDEIICRFYGLRLGFVVAEMSELRARLRQQQGELDALDARIRASQASRVEGPGRLLRALGGERRGPREAELAALLRRKHLLQVPLDESRLTAWLDAVTECSLHPPSGLRWAQPLRRARMQLLQLLGRYCVGQEETAREAAPVPFAQLDTRRVIGFGPGSESFMLGYFSRKRHQQGCWLTGAAEWRLRRIDELQNELLRELRRNLGRG